MPRKIKPEQSHTLYVKLRPGERISDLGWHPQNTERRADDIMEFLRTELAPLGFDACVKQHYSATMSAAIENILAPLAHDLSASTESAWFRLRATPEQWYVIKNIFKVRRNNAAWRGYVIMNIIGA